MKVEEKTKREMIKRLSQHYAGAGPELHYHSPFELLVATILSAQCTDKRVNQVTKELFPKYPDPQSMAQADPEELSQIVHPCGCYQVKTKNLIGTSKLLVEKFGGEVPQTLEELTTLPGVGRKTANVVLSNAFDIPGFAVDTHVFRVSNRMGLVDAKDVLETEKQLCDLFDRNIWKDAHHWLIFHGRRICSARSPKCAQCFLSDICPSSSVAK